MAWGANADIAKFDSLVKARYKTALFSFCDDLINRIYKTAEPYPSNPAKKLLTTLRRG
jgi:hypothetical protein